MREGLSVQEVIRQETGEQADEVTGKLYTSIDDVRRAVPGELVGEYWYQDEELRTSFVRFRYLIGDGQKRFISFRPCAGGWAIGEPPPPRHLFNLIDVFRYPKVVIVEGEECVRTLKRMGLPAVTSTDGSSAARRSDWAPLAGKEVVIWPDHDEPGYLYAADVMAILRELEPRVTVRLVPQGWAHGKPSGYDVTDFVRDGADKDAVVRVLRSAQRVGMVQKILARFRDISVGHYRRLPWPWPYTTKYARGLLPGAVTLITGVAGSRKSLFLLQACEFWRQRGEKVVVFEYEDEPEFHVSRWLSQVAGESGLTDPNWVRENYEVACNLARKFADDIEDFGRLWHVVDGEDTLEQVARWVDTQARRGKRIICIDPITMAERTKRPWEADKEFMKEIKAIARRQQCSVILVTHPQKGEIAKLGTIAGGSAYERFSFDILAITAFDKVRETIMAESAIGNNMARSYDTEVKVVKSRNAPGQNVRIAFRFLEDSLTFDERGVMKRRQRQKKKDDGQKD